MSSPEWVTGHLRQRNVPFTESRHRSAMTAQEMAECEHISGHKVAKVVVMLANGQPCLVVVPAARRIDLSAARHSLGADDARLATEDEMQSMFADCAVGAIPPLRHWDAVELWMDRDFSVNDDMVFAAGTHEDSIHMRFQDWRKTEEPRVGSFC